MDLLYVVHKSEEQRWGEDGPAKMTVNKQHAWISILRYHHLNMLIFKDVILKLRLAEKLQMKYRGSLSYELGIITASILDTFNSMLETYYFYTKMETWRFNMHSIEELGDAYHFIHGGYMEILAEKDKYDAILEEHKAKQRAELEQRKERERKLYERRERQRQKRLLQQQQSTTTTEGTMPTINWDNPDMMPRRRRLGPGVTIQSPSDKEFKKQMRLKKWGERWNYYDPKREGVLIEDIGVDIEEVKKVMRNKNI